MLTRMSYGAKINLVLMAGLLCVWGAVKLQRQTSIEVVCETSKGPLEIVVMPAWSPRGAERFLQLVDDGYYSNLPLFRCIDHFVCQFGPKPPRSGAKNYPPLIDDAKKPDLRYFKPGFLSFAGYAPNTRTTHVFIALAAPESLGAQPWSSVPLSLTGLVSDTLTA